MEVTNVYNPKCESSTVIESRSITASWTIKNFSLIKLKKGEKIESQQIAVHDVEPFSWVIRLFPTGVSANESENYISCSLLLISSNDRSVTASYVVSFLTGDEKCLKSLGPITDEFEKKNNGWGWSKFIERDEIINQLKDDILTIKCWIKWGIDNIDAQRRETVPLEKLDVQDKLISDLNKIMDNGNFSDITLVANDYTEFSAHKCILGARSTICFEEIRKSRLIREKKCLNVDSDTLRTMITFMYTGKFDSQKCDMDLLLVAADKYGLHDIKGLCEQEICKKLNVENVAKYLLLADRHGANHLKTKTLNFIVLHLKDVIKTDSLKHLRSEKPILFEDILVRSISNL